MKRFLVLLPYEITLFSNYVFVLCYTQPVLLPYEITLFSNSAENIIGVLSVLLPYEITLFSNPLVNNSGFNGFYYLMKLHYSQTATITLWTDGSFTTL